VIGAIILSIIAIAQAFPILSTAPGGQLPAKADLIAVFPGKQERIEAGVKLAAAGHGLHLAVASHVPTEKIIEPYLKKYPIPGNTIKTLTAGLSRDTFEDALVTLQLVKKHNFKSIILVTSDYHMTRAFTLLRLMLWNSKVQITRWAVTGNSEARYLEVLSEMVKFWGSLCELILFKVSGRLPLDFVK